MKKNKNLKISIITIVKNGMPFVKETVNSVLSQDYKSIEYIIIDCLSTDGTTEYLAMQKGAIETIINESDNGISEAFNKGLIQASGDYIMFLNSDDSLVHSSVIRDMVDSILEFNKPIIIYGDCLQLDRYTAKIISKTSVDFCKDKLIDGLMIPHPATMTSRSYFNKYGNFDTNYTIAMDYEWFLRGAKEEKVIHIPYIISFVRNGGVSTRNQIKVIAEIVRALEKNSYIKNKLYSSIIKAIFFSRFFTRILLQSIGLYGLVQFVKK